MHVRIAERRLERHFLTVGCMKYVSSIPSYMQSCLYETYLLGINAFHIPYFSFSYFVQLFIMIFNSRVVLFVSF